MLVYKYARNGKHIILLVERMKTAHTVCAFTSYAYARLSVYLRAFCTVSTDASGDTDKGCDIFNESRRCDDV